MARLLVLAAVLGLASAFQAPATKLAGSSQVAAAMQPRVAAVQMAEEPSSKAVTIGAAAVGGIVGVYLFKELSTAVFLAVLCAAPRTTRTRTHSGAHPPCARAMEEGRDAGRIVAITAACGTVAVGCRCASPSVAADAVIAAVAAVRGCSRHRRQHRRRRHHRRRHRRRWRGWAAVAVAVSAAAAAPCGSRWLRRSWRRHGRRCDVACTCARERAAVAHMPSLRA